jgi:hypothetical protein
MVSVQSVINTRLIQLSSIVWALLIHVSITSTLIQHNIHPIIGTMYVGSRRGKDRLEWSL